MARGWGESKPAVVTTGYEADEAGLLRPVLPGRCVFARGAEACSVFVDHYRARKTGPCFPLAVVGCSAHPQGRYTLYPPGHVPYGREPVAPYSPSGTLLLDGETGEPEWGETLFAAAVDAAGGERWPSDSPWDDRRRRRTQGRRLEVAARLVGVHPGLDEGVRERIATRLGVATLTLMGAARRWGPSWRERGAAVVTVLGALPLEASLLGRMLAAGALAGLWGEPRRWEAAAGMRVVARSGSAEHAVHGRPRSRGPPPTTLPAAAGAGSDVRSGS